MYYNPSALVIVSLYLSAINLYSAPSGSEVISGSGSVSQSNATTTINQSSQNLSLTWANFNIAPNETVNFIQPSSSAIAINRIYSIDGTQILGHLNANGQIYLINPNGILFGLGSKVNVGGLIASTLEMNDNTLNESIRSFSGSNPNTIINQGTITTTDGGYVALMGNHVSNEGIIIAHFGSVVLGSGSTVRLTFDGNSLIGMEVEHSLLDSLSENGGLIRADGGLVIMSSGAKDALRVSVVNNTGVIEARSVENLNGTIVLLGGMNEGIVTVGGVLDASASAGGNGGSIETSGAHVTIANDARVTTASAFGVNGIWLIDPVDFTVASSGGDITGSTLGTLLGSNSITIQSIDGATGMNGDINVNDTVTWNANNTLTLKADRNININKSISATGTSGKVALEYGQAAIEAGNTSDYTVNAPVNLSAGENFSTKQGSDGVTKIYTVITDLGVAGSMNTIDLQGINGALSGNYALGSNIDALQTSGWNSTDGFTPIGYSAPFGGTFDGLGHTVTDLAINSVTTYQGLFGKTSAVAMIRDVGVVNANIVGTAHIGGLVGNNAGTIINSYVSGNVTGTSPVGGLVGSNTGAVSNSHASVNVMGTSTLGGLLGSNTGVISDSYATGNVSGSTTLGGLIGSNINSIHNSYATGSVTGSDTTIGGLLGSNTGNVDNSYATGNIIGTTTMGGLMGSNTGIVHDTYATGNVNGTTTLGGLLGSNTGAVSNSYSVGKVSGTTTVGGLVGSNTGTGTVVNSYWDTTTSNQLTSAAGIAMDTADMQLQSNFTTWNFPSVWLMYDGITYPLLRSVMTPLVVSANNATKIYDKIGYSGGNGVTYSVTPTLMPDGAITYSGDSQGALNVGSYTLTPSGLQSNQQYFVSYVDGSLDITPKFLTVTALANTKVYDATTEAMAALTSADILSGDTVTLEGAASFDTKNVGTGKTVTVDTLTKNGSDSANYTISNPTATSTADITPASLAISGITANNKVYDATTAATLDTSAVVFNGLLGSDSVTLASFGVFRDKHAGVAKTLTLTSAYSGADVLNYAISDQATTTASITPKFLTVTALANTKVYDATTAATAALTSADILSGDTVTLEGTASFDTKNVGTGKTVTVDTLTKNGSDSANYTLSNPTATSTADITPASLAISEAPSFISIINAKPIVKKSTTVSLENYLFSSEERALEVLNDKNLKIDKGVPINNNALIESNTEGVTTIPITDSNIKIHSNVLPKSSYCPPSYQAILQLNYQPIVQKMKKLPKIFTFDPSKKLTKKHISRKSKLTHKHIYPRSKASALPRIIHRKPHNQHLKKQKYHSLNRISIICWFESINHSIVSTMTPFETITPELLILDSDPTLLNNIIKKLVNEK